MDQTQLKELVSGIVPDAVFEENKQFLTAAVEPGSLKPLMKALKDRPDASFDYLFCVSGTDVQDKLQVVYHLESIQWGHQIVLKTATADREKPQLESVSDLFHGAELHENEIFDMFGIVFKGHPNLRRMFMPDDWAGFPLRKDYKDDVNIVELS